MKKRRPNASLLILCTVFMSPKKMLRRYYNNFMKTLCHVPNHAYFTIKESDDFYDQISCGMNPNGKASTNNFTYQKTFETIFVRQAFLDLTVFSAFESFIILLWLERTKSKKIDVKSIGLKLL